MGATTKATTSALSTPIVTLDTRTSPLMTMYALRRERVGLEPHRLLWGLVRHRRSYPGRPFGTARIDFPCFSSSASDTNRLIGQPLADDAHQRQIGTLYIFDADCLAVAVTEVEFSRVAVQVFLGAVLVDAPHPALEDRIVAFDGVGVNLAASILAGLVANAGMLTKGPAKSAILSGFIGEQAGFTSDVFAQDRQNFFAVDAIDNKGLA